MAKFSKKVPGALSGLIGPIIASSNSGIPYVKSKGRKSKKPRTELQLQQQLRMTTISPFIYRMYKLLDKTFIKFANGNKGHHEACGFNMKNALTGEYPAFVIDYSRVLVGRGDLVNASNITAMSKPGGLVQFDWEDNSGVGIAKPVDRAIAIIYSPILKLALYVIGLDFRKNCRTILDASNHLRLQGTVVESWLLFMSKNEKEVSDSAYTGQILIN